MKWALALALAAVSSVTFAAGGSTYPLEQIEPDYTDKVSLQRGLATYSHYCMGCHSLEYQRYERTATDLGIDLEIMVQAIVPSDKKIGDLGGIAMPAKAAAEWFGAPPPDLTLVARKRSPEWVYTYMKTFYVDPTRPLGVNNKVFPKVGMPHVLEPLQGQQRAVCEDLTSVENRNAGPDAGSGQSLTESQCGSLEVIEGTAQLSAAEYDRLIYDLVNFLEYVGEPTKARAHSIGIYVLLFLMLFFVFAYLLKREYWKDVQ
ncbi:MAG TPA: cytochrome c1 [Gammaproteobacteria bacterium]|nr:cytochrome c1 [Gammaproteobacteria bacterium]HBX26897.1 cytochrome c1 [Gammaproteobacteria bacterium]